MSELTLNDIDPDITAEVEELGDITPDEVFIGRVMRALRFVRHDLKQTEFRFEREQERIEDARQRACEPLANRCADLERILTGWFEQRRAAQIRAGTDPKKVRKSIPFPDGTIKVRQSTTVDIDGKQITTQGLPSAYAHRRVTYSLDREAVKKAVKAGLLTIAENGRLVTEGGEVLPITYTVKDTSSVDTEAVE